MCVKSSRWNFKKKKLQLPRKICKSMYIAFKERKSRQPLDAALVVLYIHIHFSLPVARLAFSSYTVVLYIYSFDSPVRSRASRYIYMSLFSFWLYKRAARRFCAAQTLYLLLCYLKEEEPQPLMLILFPRLLVAAAYIIFLALFFFIQPRWWLQFCGEREREIRNLLGVRYIFEV